METMDPTKRFTDRVADYVRYRPSYPAAVLECLSKEGGLAPGQAVADIGSGTGILSAALLSQGFEVHAVEPNGAMRQAAEQALGDHPRHHSLEGRAEETGLADSSVQAVTCGQSFHWFEAARARAEFERILVPGGLVALVWNERCTEHSAFMSEYEAVLLAYAIRYEGPASQNVNALAIEQFFDPYAVNERSFKNAQRLDWEGLCGRLLSSSYAPLAGHAHHEPMMKAVRELFERYSTQAEGEDRAHIDLLYRTRLFWGLWHG